MDESWGYYARLKKKTTERQFLHHSTYVRYLRWPNSQKQKVETAEGWKQKLYKAIIELSRCQFWKRKSPENLLHNSQHNGLYPTIYCKFKVLSIKNTLNLTSPTEHHIWAKQYPGAKLLFILITTWLTGSWATCWEQLHAIA